VGKGWITPGAMRLF